MSRTIYVYDKNKGGLTEVAKMPAKRNAAGTWPRASDSLGCSSLQQVRDEQSELAKRGVKTEYDDEFRPIFRSRAHRKAHMRALEYYDPDAGYGDAEPLNFHTGIKRDDVTNPTTRARLRQEGLEKLQGAERRLFGKVLTHG